MEQDDLKRLVEKRWKRYKLAQKRRKVASGATWMAMRAAGVTAGFLRKMRVLRQIRKERVTVE